MRLNIEYFTLDEMLNEILLTMEIVAKLKKIYLKIINELP